MRRRHLRRKKCSEVHALNVDGETLIYTLERKNVRNINLRIRPDASISKGSFIVDALERIMAAKADRSRYDDGDKAYFLGRPLEVKLSQGPRVNVYIDGDFLLIQMPEPTNVSARIELVKRWYKRQASDVFMSALHDVYDEFRFVYQVPFPHVTIRQMKSRWGSCHPDLGKITLNLLLVTASYEDLRYVVVHELAHFIEANHSKSFWDVVGRFEPNYKDKRRSLCKLPTKW